MCRPVVGFASGRGQAPTAVTAPSTTGNTRAGWRCLVSSLIVVIAVDLNQATRAEIEAVRGVGVELADRIIAARAQGPLQDWDDLRRRVKGVSRRALSGFAEAQFEIGGRRAPQN